MIKLKSYEAYFWDFFLQNFWVFFLELFLLLGKGKMAWKRAGERDEDVIFSYFFFLFLLLLKMSFFLFFWKRQNGLEESRRAWWGFPTDDPLNPPPIVHFSNDLNHFEQIWNIWDIFGYFLLSKDLNFVSGDIPVFWDPLIKLKTIFQLPLFMRCNFGNFQMKLWPTNVFWMLSWFNSCQKINYKL